MDFLPSAHTAAVMILVALSVCGYLLTLAPVVPGTLMVPLAAVAWGLLDGFSPFAWHFWLGQALLVAAYLIVDNVAQHYGVKRIGGSKAAMWGGVIGVMAGPFLVAPVLGPLALFVGPPLGAVVGVLLGQVIHRRREERRRRQSVGDVLDRARQSDVGLNAARKILTADQQREQFLKDKEAARKEGFIIDPAPPKSDAAQILPVGATMRDGVVERDGQALAPAVFVDEAVASGPSHLKLAVGALAAYIVGTAAKLVVFTIQVVWIALAV
jgi:uncharacterized protein YqgC (DUF456 family)